MPAPPAPYPAASVPDEFAVLLACLQQVAEVRKRAMAVTTGEVTEQARYLLHGRCAIWPATDPLTARAERVAGHLAAILARL